MIFCSILYCLFHTGWIKVLMDLHCMTLSGTCLWQKEMLFGRSRYRIHGRRKEKNCIIWQNGVVRLHPSLLNLSVMILLTLVLKL